MIDLISREDAIAAVQQSMTAMIFDDMTIKEAIKEIGTNTKDIAISRIEHLPSVGLVPRPEKCIDGAVQEHDNGMVSMTKTTWEDTKATLERYKGEIEDFYIAGYKKEHDGCDGCHYEHYGEDQAPCTECCQNYTDEYTPKKDLVEVVRCADCKYKYPKDMDMFCRFFIGGPLMASGYCSRGERK